MEVKVAGRPQKNKKEGEKRKIEKTTDDAIEMQMTEMKGLGRITQMNKKKGEKGTLKKITDDESERVSKNKKAD